MKHTHFEFPPEGLGKLERKRYSALLRGTQVTISVTEAANILDMPKEKATMFLSLLAKKGWLKRIYYGVYIPVPPESDTKDIVAEEPFVIAEKLFSPCYIGSMNAANYWEFTDQMFNTVTVMTQKQVRKRQQEISGTQFIIHTLKKKYFFGLKTVWLGNVKVKVSDPSRTIVDMMLFPQFSGGTTFSIDVLETYFKSKHEDIDLLISYFSQAGNGAAIKRLGFLTDRNFPEQKKLISYCSTNMTKGYSKLNPSMSCPKLITKWNLRVPEKWTDTDQ